METELRPFVAIPASRDRKEEIWLDIFIKTEKGEQWLGSRRTKEQCKMFIEWYCK